MGQQTNILKKCGDCGSNLLNKQEITAEDWIKFIEQELESANHYDYIDLPDKIFNKISKLYPINAELDIAKIMAESFYENI